MCGQVLNGFSYIANRWIWAYGLLIGYIVVDTWHDLVNISKKQAIITFDVLMAYLLVCIFAFDEIDTNTLWVIFIGFLAWGVAVLKPKIKKKHISSAIVFALIFATIAVNSYYRFNENQKNYQQQYISYSDVQKKISKSVSKKVKKVTTSDESFYRYSRVSTQTQFNVDLIYGTKSTSFYWSLQNPNIAQFLEEMELPNKHLYLYENFNNRASLNSLFDVKYYYADETDTVPYSYTNVDNKLYQSDSYLPLGFTYSSYFTRDEYEKLSAVEKQSAIMQGAMLEEGNDNYQKTDLTFDDKTVPYTISAGDNVTIDGDKIIVSKSKSKVTITFDGLENSETYIDFDFTDFEAYDENSQPGFPVLNFALNSDGEKIASEKLMLQTKYDMRYTGQSKYSVNVGYSEKACNSVTISFGSKGTYTLADLKVICQPMNSFDTQVSALGENVLENIKSKNNVVSGTIDLDENKLLCLSIPYSSGWTAYVDGEKVDIMQANTMFMAIDVQAGQHNVKLVYKTPMLKIGICASALGAVAFVCVIVFYEYKQKRKKIND
jgi:uncharacterized membrane protein YfhO